MTENRGLLSGGWGRVRHNKRYIVWFYVLNAGLAWLGAAGFSSQAHVFLDHSLLANRLVQGLDFGVLNEMRMQPAFGSPQGAARAATHLAVLYSLLSALFLPGVLQGYAANWRLPREDFFRACGRNLWRFIRLMIVAGIVFLIVAGALFAMRAVLLKKAGESTNELLPFYVSMASLFVIFLVMMALRICFDLAEADVVLSDQRAVRKSIGVGFQHTWRDLGRLLGSYLAITIVAAMILLTGLWVWMRFVAPENVLGAVVVSQLTLLLLLIPRFWQRGVVVTYYLQSMVELIPAQSFMPASAVSPAAAEPPPAAPVIPGEPAKPQVP
jgi:hypothetical protein